jgi:hypothetical protein
MAFPPPQVWSFHYHKSLLQKPNARLVVCTGGRFGGVLATVRGVRPVRGVVSPLWRGDGERRAAVLSAAGPRTLCHQPCALLAPQQTVAPVARLYRLTAPPAFRKATPIPSPRSPPQCRRSCPFVNKRGCPRTFPPAIRQLEETATPTVPHLTLPSVVTYGFFGWSCNVILVWLNLLGKETSQQLELFRLFELFRNLRQIYQETLSHIIHFII